MGFKERVEELMKEQPIVRPMELKDLSSLTGIHTKTLKSILKGDAVDAKYQQVQEIAGALKVPIAFLMTGSGGIPHDRELVKPVKEGDICKCS